jgi:hypothetical protein
VISETALDQAVARNVLSATQAADLRAIAQAEAEVQRADLPATPMPASMPPPIPVAASDANVVDDEKLRFITGFADIFVTIGIALFCWAATDIAARFVGDTGKWGILAGLVWALAEFFTRRRRMALPSIVLLLLFTIAIFNFVLGLVTPDDAGSYLVRRFEHLAGWANIDARSALIAGLATVAFAALHYWRFRVPITVAAGAGALGIAVFACIHWINIWLDTNIANYVFLFYGVCVFALAMWFDMSDPARETRRTDIAFWLHLLAAPLIVHPIIALFAHGPASQMPAAFATLGIFLVFSLVSLAIDRRALLVSGLTYAGIAFTTIIRQTGLADRTGAPTLLALGLFILLLSAGWRPLRNVVLRLLPSVLTQRLPHPHSQMS